MRIVRRAPARRAVVAAATAAIATATLATSSPAQESRPSLSYAQDIHLTYEFDDNVREELSDPINAQVAKISYVGDLRWGGGDQRLAFSYAGGFKQHLDVGRLANGRVLDVPSQFLHQGSLEYLRRLDRDVFVRGRMGARSRTWTGDLPFVNEDEFRLYSGEVGAIVNLQPLEPNHPVRLEVGLRYSDIRFENLDEFFGNWTVGGDVSLVKEFDSSLDARATYSFDQIRYPGRGAVEPGEEIFEVIGGVDRPRQEDRIHELGAEVEWFGPVGILAEYRFRYNDSNSFGFDNFSHNFGVQLLRQLPWDMLVQAYGQVQLRTYTEPVPAFPAGEVEVGEPEDNVLLLRLVKDINEAYSMEARYARYRNESINLNDFYSKNIWSIGVTIRP